MIRAIIYKDLRQQWPWLLGVTLLALACGTVHLVRWPASVNWACVLLSFFGRCYSYVDATPPLVRLEELYGLASIYGAVLGLLQGLSDTRATADFFLHRPCSRTRLAVAKLIGGSLLFWVPGLVTIVLMTLWAGLGRFASPFCLWMPVVPLLSLGDRLRLLPGGGQCGVASGPMVWPADTTAGRPRPAWGPLAQPAKFGVAAGRHGFVHGDLLDRQRPSSGAPGRVRQWLGIAVGGLRAKSSPA